MVGRAKFGFYSPRRERKLIFPSPPGQLTVMLHLEPSTDLTHEEKLFSFLVGMGIQGGKHENPYRLDIKMAPVALIHTVHKKGVKYLLEKGIMRLTGEAFELKIEAESGNLIELIHNDETIGKLTLTTENGIFDRMVKQLEECSEEYRNDYNTEKPFSSAIGYLLQEVVESKFLKQAIQENLSEEKYTRAIAVMSKIIEQEPLSPLATIIL